MSTNEEQLVAQLGADLGKLVDVGDRPDLRFNAAHALGKLGAVAAPHVPDLIKLFHDASPYVRGTAALAVGKIGPPLAGDPQQWMKTVPTELTKLCSDEDAGVRAQAARAIGLIGQHLQLNKNANAPKGFERYGEIIAPMIAKLLKDKDVEVKTASAVAMSNLGTCAANHCGGLAELVAANEHWVRATGLKALAELNANKAAVAPEIHKLFSHEDESVRAAAAEGMAGVGKSAVPHVTDMAKLLADDSAKVREAASKNLIALDQDAVKAVPELTRLLQHKSEEAKRKAYQVLNGIKKWSEIPNADRQAYESWQKERNAANTPAKAGAAVKR
jgi:HEAT repeat protein